MIILLNRGYFEVFKKNIGLVVEGLLRKFFLESSYLEINKKFKVVDRF